MITHLLDTNIISYALRPQNQSLANRLHAAMVDEYVAISVATRAEIRAGQYRMTAQDKRRTAIDQLLDVLPVLVWTAQAADIYGETHTLLMKKGQPIGIMDVQIAAHALAENLILVTHNTRHFERIPGLKLEDWMV
ncbi:MAG: type II toxin-antitoxin system VapC family toxin [Rhodoferax sp.]|jgi:tRNA(fMet)-specific endonuclease VapC|nr:type II toxin-antitoxin system VapC family toxin [Rhodoferax sp.]